MQHEEEPLELDVKAFVEFYYSLPEGRGTNAGARFKQLENALDHWFGRRSTLRPRAQSSYWIGSKSTIEGWKRTPPTRPVMLPEHVFLACWEIWDKDLTKDQCIGNRFLVRSGAEDLLEVGRVNIEPLGPDAERSHLLRCEKIRLKQKSKNWTQGGKPCATITFGFLDAKIVAELPERPNEPPPNVLIRFLDPDTPSQNGAVHGATINWLFPETEWQMVMPPSAQLLNIQLINASLIEFDANSGDNIALSVIVDANDFKPYIHLDFPSESDDQNENDRRRIRNELLAQILKSRPVGHDRYVLGSGKLVVK